MVTDQLYVEATSVSVNFGGNIILIFYVHGIDQDFENNRVWSLYDELPEKASLMIL